MSAPTVLDENFKFNFEFEVTSNKGKKFLIILKAESYSYLAITATNKTDIFKQIFSNKFSVEEIKKNKYMNIYDDLKEICDELKIRMENGPVTLKEENNSLMIIIPLPNNKIKEISFELKELERKENDYMNEMAEIISEIKKENESLKKEIKEIKIDYNKLKNITDIQKEEITKLKEQMVKLFEYHNEIKKEKEEKLGLNLESSIINDNIEYKKALKNWINPNKKIEAQLLYSKSRDGDQISKFHELCDNKGPTLTVFKTEDGNIGGIYTPLDWDMGIGWKNDWDSFMFNLNKCKKYKKIRIDNSIYATKGFGPWTYAFGFYDRYQMNKIEHGGICINVYFENGAEILPNNSKNIICFNVVNVEVFKINMN